MNPCYRCASCVIEGHAGYCVMKRRPTGLRAVGCPDFQKFVSPLKNKRGLSTGEVAQCNNTASIPENDEILQGRGRGCPEGCTMPGGIL